MQQIRIEQLLGFQRLSCKKPGCGYLFKEIHFSAGWAATPVLDSGVALTNNGAAPYYLCPQCKTKNIVSRQGEKIILEKIIRFESTREENISTGTIIARPRVDECIC
jgi:hypothetical protein